MLLWLHACPVLQLSPVHQLVAVVTARPQGWGDPVLLVRSKAGKILEDKPFPDP